MHVELQDQDGQVLGIVGLDDRGRATLDPGGQLDAGSLFDREFFVSPEWAKANGAGELPVVQGVVRVSPFDGEPYLRALAYFSRTGYTTGVLVDA
jgi:hypothetical protein